MGNAIGFYKRSFLCLFTSKRRLRPLALGCYKSRGRCQISWLYCVALNRDYSRGLDNRVVSLWDNYNQNQKEQEAANQEENNNKTFPSFPFLSLLVEPRSGERFAASEASSEAATKQQTNRGLIIGYNLLFLF